MTRGMIGNLNSYTDSKGVNSPAEWGVRTLDAGGNIIFDSLGLIGVMGQLGANSQGGTPYTGTGNFSSYISALTTTINVLRAVTVLVNFTIWAYTAGGTGNYFYGRISYGDGIASNNGALFDKLNPGYSTSGNITRHRYAAAGTYTVSVDVQGDSGQTLNSNGIQLQVWQLGN